jgi:acetylornithine deacetylase/succinyl-diaminopimelate desuccinylase-like protein
MVVGERTGEEGSELFGAVCPSSRGVARVYLTARGVRGHTGTGAVPGDLIDRFIEARQVLGSVFERYLTLVSDDGWVSSARFPFISIGEPFVYNISAGEGLLGIELRPIPEDDVQTCVGEVARLCTGLGFEVTVEVMEAGPQCPPDNPHLARLIAAVETVSGEPAPISKKKPGSSARFAPGGNAVVWGQSGHGPHSREEWHYLPSIGPYLDVLDEFAQRSLAEGAD